MDKLKKCACGCEKEFPATSEYFTVDKRTPDGWRCYTKICRNRNEKRLREKYREKNRNQTEECDISKYCWKCDCVYPLTEDYWNKDCTRRDGWNAVHIGCQRKMALETRKRVKQRNLESKIPKESMPDKYCPGCDTIKSAIEFAYNAGSSGGLDCYCNGCNATIKNNRRRPGRGKFTESEFQSRCEEQGWQCCYCGCDIEDYAVREHFYSLEEGGTNNIDNIVASCTGCNSSKHDVNPFKWIMETFGLHHPMLHFIGEKIEDLLLLVCDTRISDTSLSTTVAKNATL